MDVLNPEGILPEVWRQKADADDRWHRQVTDPRIVS